MLILIMTNFPMYYHQCNNGTIKGYPRDKLYQEFGHEYLQQRTWMRTLP